MTPVIKDTIINLVSVFLYYDRKEDEDLPEGAIEQAIRDKQVSIEEIADEFHDQLQLGLQRVY